MNIVIIFVMIGLLNKKIGQANYRHIQNQQKEQGKDKGIVNEITIEQIKYC